MIVLRTKQFSKKVEKLPKPIKLALIARLRIFMTDPKNSVLNNHALTGSKKHFSSINITGDYRVIYEKLTDDALRLTDIDTHSNLYGS
jgi:addiction module RelE/StbE family toxin